MILTFFFQSSLSLLEITIKKGVLIPSSLGLHSDSSEASLPRLSRPCRIPSSTKAPLAHGVNYP